MTEKKQFQQTGWRLNELMQEFSDSEIKKALDRIEQATKAIEAMRPALSADMSSDDFRSLIAAVEEFAEAVHRVGGYGTLRFSADTQDQEALAFMGRVEQLATEAQNRVMFAELWWRGLEDNEAAKLIEHAGDTRYYFEKQRLFKPHTLSEPEEKVINLKDVNGTNALITVYDLITSKFEFTLEEDGKKQTFTRDVLMQYVRDPRPEIREAVYRELYRVFGAEASVLAQIYNARVRDWDSENIGLRKISSAIAVRNLSNDIPDEVVDTLLEVCRTEAGVFQKYFRLKAGWTGVKGDRLRRFDLYAPLSTSSTKNIPYTEAVEKVLDSFSRFSPEAERLARRVFEEGHIDSEIRPTKRGGAFCYSVTPKLAPWVLANYTGEPRQVATLAHELGHAIHSMLAEEHSVLTFHSALPMAETASVFSEMLLMDRLKAEEKDPLVRRDMLAGSVDDMYATVMRQAYFVMFERQAHEMVQQGATREELEKAYLQNLAEQFGNSIEVDDVFRHEWISIPHIFHTPFYCYAYSFGMLLSLALYQQYKEGKEGFTEKLLTILRAGGSKSPEGILTEAGIDMRDAEFWRGGFRVIEGTVDELEKGG